MLMASLWDKYDSDNTYDEYLGEDNKLRKQAKVISNILERIGSKKLQEIERNCASTISARGINFRVYSSGKKAQEMGAMALFGEKYGDVVRVIKFGTSAELCGGIHVPSTSHIGLFKIVSESAVASGIRRVEAISSEQAMSFYEDRLSMINELGAMLKTQDVMKSVRQLIEENQQLNKKVAQLNTAKAGDLKTDLLKEAKEINGVDFIAKSVELDAKAIKNLAFELTKSNDNLLLVLASQTDGKVTLTIALSEKLSQAKGLHAGNMVRELAQEIKGGGGGQAFFATAGGKDASGIPTVLQKAENYL